MSDIVKVKYLFDPFKQQDYGVILTKTDEELIVPMDTNNRHYLEVLEWVQQGNVIEESDTSENTPEPADE